MVDEKPESEPPRHGLVLRGRVIGGVGRGKDLVEKYYDRIRSILGFRPFHGTLNVELEKPVEITKFETRRIDHILLDGKPFVEMRMAPARLYYKDRIVDCWFIRQELPPYEKQVVELISEDSFKEKLGIREFDEVKVELTEIKRSILSRLRPPQISYSERRIHR